jgi:hypothetical protein
MGPFSIESTTVLVSEVLTVPCFKYISCIDGGKASVHLQALIFRVLTLMRNQVGTFKDSTWPKSEARPPPQKNNRLHTAGIQPTSPKLPRLTFKEKGKKYQNPRKMVSFSRLQMDGSCAVVDMPYYTYPHSGSLWLPDDTGISG